MKRVDVGRVVKAHGLRGQVVVGGVRLTLEEFVALGHVYARGVAGTTGEKAATRRLDVTEAKPFQHTMIVRFAGFDRREEADELHGVVLEVDPAQLPVNDEGTVYLFQLVGLAVTTDAGQALGKVAEVLQTGATPILIVREATAPEGEKPRERMLPMSAEVLKNVDTAAGTVTVHLLPGMEEL